MTTFEMRLRYCRNEKILSQNELNELLNINHSVIGKYELDGVKPSIDVAEKLADLFDTIVAYLIGKTEANELFKDTDMLRRLIDNYNLPEKNKTAILCNLDALLRDAKTRLAYF